MRAGVSCITPSSLRSSDKWMRMEEIREMCQEDKTEKATETEHVSSPARCGVVRCQLSTQHESI